MTMAWEQQKNIFCLLNDLIFKSSQEFKGHWAFVAYIKKVEGQYYKGSDSIAALDLGNLNEKICNGFR